MEFDGFGFGLIADFVGVVLELETGVAGFAVAALTGADLVAATAGGGTNGNDDGPPASADVNDAGATARLAASGASA